MRILNPDGSPAENPTIEQQIAALMAGHDTLANSLAKQTDDVAALIVNVTAHGERLAKLESPALASESELTAKPLPRAVNTVNGREV